MLRFYIAAACLSLSACGGGNETTAPETGTHDLSAAQPVSQIGNLPAFFDCVRKESAVVIAAHRGGPVAGYPENAIETMANALQAGIRVFEVDVATSQDGVLYLMHDRSLRRTAGYNGEVADTDWSVVSGLELKDSAGARTGFHPPKLSDALEWAKQNGAILELDKKETTSFRDVVSAVQAAGAENNVIMISYNDNQAKQIASLAPDLMMTASVRSIGHQRDLEAAGVRAENLIVWMGTERPNTRAFYAVGKRGLESAFGTLGRPGERLDDTYLADGDASEYQALVDGGLSLLATDEPFEVARQLTSDDMAWERCSS